MFLIWYRAWDEKKVVAWLHSIKCGEYESLFRGELIIGCVHCQLNSMLILSSEQF